MPSRCMEDNEEPVEIGGNVAVRGNRNSSLGPSGLIIKPVMSTNASSPFYHESQFGRTTGTEASEDVLMRLIEFEGRRIQLLKDLRESLPEVMDKDYNALKQLRIDIKTFQATIKILSRQERQDMTDILKEVKVVLHLVERCLVENEVQSLLRNNRAAVVVAPSDISPVKIKETKKTCVQVSKSNKLSRLQEETDQNQSNLREDRVELEDFRLEGSLRDLVKDTFMIETESCSTLQRLTIEVKELEETISLMTATQESMKKQMSNYARQGKTEKVNLAKDGLKKFIKEAVGARINKLRTDYTEETRESDLEKESCPQMIDTSDQDSSVMQGISSMIKNCEVPLVHVDGTRNPADVPETEPDSDPTIFVSTPVIGGGVCKQKEGLTYDKDPVGTGLNKSTRMINMVQKVILWFMVIMGSFVTDPKLVSMKIEPLAPDPKLVSTMREPRTLDSKLVPSMREPLVLDPKLVTMREPPPTYPKGISPMQEPLALDPKLVSTIRELLAPDPKFVSTLREQLVASLTEPMAPEPRLPTSMTEPQAPLMTEALASDPKLVPAMRESFVIRWYKDQTGNEHPLQQEDYGNGTKKKDYVSDRSLAATCYAIK